MWIKIDCHQLYSLLVGCPLQRAAVFLSQRFRILLMTTSKPAHISYKRQDQISPLDNIQACIQAVVFYFYGLLWTYLPTWDNLLLWQDKPVGAGITQFGGKWKPECFQFDKDTNINGQHGNDIDANMDAASGLRISEHLVPKTPLYQSSEAPAAGSEVGNGIF